MDEQRALAQRYEADRPHLRRVAYRLLGSHVEADDALQDAWLRISRHGGAGVDNPTGWFTTIVARVCLTALQSRRARREEPLEGVRPEADPADVEQDAVLADAVGAFLLLVLDALPPAERLAFVLHDLFAVPFEEIAPVVERSPAAARQLASRGRRRVRGAAAAAPDAARRRQVVEAFLAASREGDFGALLAVLDPDVVLRADPVAVRTAAASRAAGGPALAAEVHGADAVSRVFAGRASAAQLVLVDGRVGATWAPGGVPRAVFDMVVVSGRIVAIEVLHDPDLLQDLDLRLL